MEAFIARVGVDRKILHEVEPIGILKGIDKDPKVVIAAYGGHGDRKLL